MAKRALLAVCSSVIAGDRRCGFWSVYPYIESVVGSGTTINWQGDGEIGSDALSFFVNYRNPFLGQFVLSTFAMEQGAHTSLTSYLGYLPLLLIFVGLFKLGSWRKMLPWVLPCAAFLLLRLGSQLNINGVVYPDIPLPKVYLDALLPPVFEAFREVDHFMIGALLPFAILVCYGLAGLQGRIPAAAWPKFVLALVLLICLEYYAPVQEQIVNDGHIAFLDWLDNESDGGPIGVINLPLGRRNSKLYNFYQTLSGYPQVEGAISRTPDSAFDYIRANYLLNAWYRRRPINCEMSVRETYLAGLEQLVRDGFSHVVYHRHLQNWAEIRESFNDKQLAYRDGLVSIYRLSDLPESCPEAPSLSQRFTWAYAGILRNSDILSERNGTIVAFAPTAEAADQFIRYLRHFALEERAVVTVSSDEQGMISLQSSELPDSQAAFTLDQYGALWLANDASVFDAEQSAAYRDWFLKRFKFCERAAVYEGRTIDIYARSDIPCSAIDGSSTFEIRYDNGLRLRNASVDVGSGSARVYLAWTKDGTKEYGFSLQFFDEGGQKALQYDNVISRDLLWAHEIDSASLSAGLYSVQLIVYDFETRASQGGTIADTGERFARELTIGALDLRR